MSRACASQARSRVKERGSVLAYTVLSVLFLFLAVGLGVDLSHLYLVKNELQNAADASALAGASALLLKSDEKIATAVDRALVALNENKYNFNNKEFDDTMTLEAQRNLVEFAVNLNDPDASWYKEGAVTDPESIRFVRVVTPSVSVNIFFALPVLGTSKTVTARATAGLSVPINVFCNYLPIAVVEGNFGEGVGWDEGPCYPKVAPKEGEEECDPKEKFCPGCKYKIIAGPGAWGDSSPGNYQALDAGDGAKDLKLAIASGTTGCLTSTDDAEFITETEPGRMTGPVQKGLNTRFDVYDAFGGKFVTIDGVKKRIEEAFPPDKNIYEGPDPPPKHKGDWEYIGLNYKDYKETPGTYYKAPTNTADSFRREISLPIIKKWAPGKTEVTFDRVGKFFLNKKVDGNNAIYAEFMEPAQASGGFDPDGGSTAPVVVPVLYK